jgi:phosphoserine phosphatase
MKVARSAPSPAVGTTQTPLCVDLDGTLIATDMLWECVVAILRERPWVLLLTPIWLMRGKAYLKRALAEHANVDVAALPIRPEVLAFVRREREYGRPIVLVTAADQRFAGAVARHIGVFAEVIASDGVTNLKGKTKADRLVQRFGRGQFDYIGDSEADVSCWSMAERRYATGDRRLPPVHGLTWLRNPSDSRSFAGATLRVLRPHQWVKNVLLFLPMIASHRLDWSTITAGLVAFAAFSLVASGGYVVNDLCDVASDRRHPRKRTRPLASGALSIPSGFALAGAAWMLGFGIAFWLADWNYVFLLLGYLCCSIAYSVRLKREPVLDVFILAGLYVMRVIAGGIVTGIGASPWLLAFALFCSLSLAFLKRYIEVAA